MADAKKIPKGNVTVSRKIDLSDWLKSKHEQGVDAKNFELDLAGEDIDFEAEHGLNEPGVEYRMASRFIRNLRILSSLNGRKAILVHMKSCGGDWGEGIAIYDAIKACPNKITILNYTHARSMTSIILQAADKRVMMPNSHFMFHLGELSFEGTYTQFMTHTEWVKEEYKKMIEIYVDSMRVKGKYRKKSRESIARILKQEMMEKEEVYLTARQAVEWGLADEIFDGNWQKLRKFPRTRK